VLSIFKKTAGLNARKKVWVSVKIDRLVFEQQTSRYFLILKASGKYNNESITVTIGNLYDENILPSLLGKGDSQDKLLKPLGIKLKKIRLLKKVNSNDSSECVFQVGFFRKTVRMSSIDAVRLAIDYGMNMDVPDDLIKAEKFDLQDSFDVNSKMVNNVFSSKFIEREIFNNREVIM
jgi:hypothetical protein